MSDDAIRLSVNITPEVARKLKRQAEISDINLTTAVARAINLWAFAEDQRLRGGNLAIQDARGDLSRVTGWES